MECKHDYDYLRSYGLMYMIIDVFSCVWCEDTYEEVRDEDGLKEIN